MKGREALKITWDDGPNKVYDSKAYRAQLEASVKKPGKVERNEGDVDKALASAAKVITAEYYAPHIAHATMEPPAATARMSDGKWEVWAPVQSPGGTRDDVAKALGVKPEEMTLHTTLLGGGFGRKSKCDFAIEAALLSKEMGGAPVKVVWTREDDIRHGFYHTVTAERFEAGLDAANKVIAWRHRSAAPSFMANFVPDPEASLRHRARHGVGGHALQRAQHPHGERRGAKPRAGRLVPLRQQRGARLVDPVLHCRAGRTSWARTRRTSCSR